MIHFIRQVSKYFILTKKPLFLINLYKINLYKKIE